MRFGVRASMGLVFSAFMALLGPARALATEPELTRLPKLKALIEPRYPPGREAAGETSSVLLELEVDAEGRVTSAAIVESGGADFDAAAIEAAQRLEFEPAELDGAPVPVKLLFRYSFTLRTEVVPVGPQVNFEGVVLERFQKTPLAGITIALEDLGRTAVTSTAGRFAFEDLPLGTHRVVVSGPMLVTVSTEETLSAGKKVSVTYLVEARAEGIDDEEVVRAPRIKKQSAEIALRAEEAKRIPGTQGDTLKVVQNLPGVARAQAGSGALVVWGAAPRDTRVLVDELELPALYHLGGVRSTVNSDLVLGLELVPGGYRADYGRGLGGLVRVTTRPLPEDKLTGFLAVDVLDASALISVPLSKRLRFAVAGRYGWLDRLLSGVVDAESAELFPIPRYRDYQAKATLDLREGESISALVLGSHDRLSRRVDSADPNEVRSDEVGLDFWRASLHYTRLAPTGESVQIAPGIGFDRQRRRSTFGAVPAELEVETLRYQLRASHRARFSEFGVLATGLDLEGRRAHVVRFGSLSVPPREGDRFVFGQPPGDDVSADDYRVEIVGAGPFLTAELQLGPLEVSPGLRLEAYALSGDRLFPRVGAARELGFTRVSLVLEPRILARWRVRERLAVHGALGLYHQPPAPEDLSAQVGSTALGPERALHATLGTTVGWTDTLSTELVGFYKHLEDRVTRNPSPSPALGRALLQEGTGRSFGAQLLLRQQLAEGFFGWLSYALSRSDRTDTPGGPTRLFDFDQTHVLSLVGSYALSDWTFGARVRFATGVPRTPIAGAFVDLRGDTYAPIFGPQNSRRLPSFFQADVRVERSFVMSWARLGIYLDLQNVTFRRNVEELAYTFDYGEEAPITGLPFLGVFGARLEL